MFNGNAPPPTPTVTVATTSSSIPTPTPPTKSRSPNSTIGDLITQHETEILRVSLASAGILALLSQAPLGDGLKVVLSSRVHVLVPIVLLYLSAKFGWKKVSKVALLWLLGFTPVSVLF